MFLFFAFAGTQCVKLAYDPLKQDQANAGQAVATAGLLLYVALSFGISLAVNVWIFYRVCGGIFNPAVTLGVVLLGAMPPLKGVILVVAQLVGGIAAAGLAQAMLPGDLAVNTSLGGGINTAQGFFLEAFLTFELTLTIYMLAVEKVSNQTSFLTPLSLLGGGNANPAFFAAPSYIHGPYRYWSCPICRASRGYLLHRRIFEPRTHIRPRSHH